MEEEGQGGALTARQHPNPITDCGHSAAGRVDAERNEAAERRRTEINKWRPQRQEAGGKGGTNVQKEKKKRQASLSVEVKGNVLIQ